MNHDTLYENILSFLDQGKDRAEILSSFSPSDREEAQIVLSLIASISNNSNNELPITPSKQALRSALDRVVTAPGSNRFFVAKDGASNQSFFQLFITSLHMQKPIAVGVGAIALILAVGVLSVAVFRTAGPLGDVDQSLAAEDGALASDFAELDTFLASDASFENDLLAFADMTSSKNGSADLDTMDRELSDDAGAFSEDFETFEDFSDETSDEDLNAIAS